MGRATPSPPTRKHARSMGSVTLPVGVNVEKKATKSTKQSITVPSRSLPSQVKPVKDDLVVLVANLTVDCVKKLKTTQCIALMKHLGIQRGTHQSDRRVKVCREKLTNFVSSTDNNFAPQLKIDVDKLIKQGHASKAFNSLPLSTHQSFNVLSSEHVTTCFASLANTTPGLTYLTMRKPRCNIYKCCRFI